MRHLTGYTDFEYRRIVEGNFNPWEGLSQDQIDFLDTYISGIGPKWEYDRETGLVNIQGSFNMTNLHSKDFKGVKFGVVTGDFFCDRNELTSLEGCPQVVGKIFDCSHNQLTSLEGCPQVVGKIFDCSHNQLTSLEGSPQEVGGYFDCTENELKTLKGCPQVVGSDFNCSNNKLKTLEGSPQKIEYSFWCDSNKLTSLEGSPQEIGGDFSCQYNTLTSLEGYPQKVEGRFIIDLFTFIEGQMSLKSLWELFSLYSNRNQRKLLSTIFSEEVLQKKIDEDPNKMTIELRPIWKEVKKEYPNLRFPEEDNETIDDLSDLSDLGF